MHPILLGRRRRRLLVPRARAKQEAERRLRVANEQIDRRLQDARRALDESSRKRVAVLEQLMQVYGTLESVPAILENAYQEMNVAPESGLALSSAPVHEAVTYDAVSYGDDRTAMVVENADAAQYNDAVEDVEYYENYEYEDEATR